MICRANCRIDATFDFIGVSSYGNRPSPAQELKSGWDSTGEVRLTKDMDQSMIGKNVILVEDILDTGLTLTYLKKLLMARQPKSLPHRRAAGQTFAPKTADSGRLRRFQHSRRVRGRLWPGLCGEVPQSSRHLRRAAGRMMRTWLARISEPASVNSCDQRDARALLARVRLRARSWLLSLNCYR